jgi:DNA-binding NtrC family response regulator
VKAKAPVIHVLLVDDDDPFRDALAAELKHSGFQVEALPDAESALGEVETRSFDVAIVDLNLPELGGEDLLRLLRERSPSTEVIILTGHGTIENAVRTLKDGAYDFLTKPCNLDELEEVVRKAFEKRSLVRQNRLLQRELARHDRFREFVGQSAELGAVLQMISKVSQSESTVLIHLQSELFGHERGAFTGAVARKHGLFEVADGGTVFLDEIGEISLSLQARILRVLDTGTFRRVGGVRDIKVDVRVICATNRDLLQMVSDGGFRQDLFYRINVVSFTLPPLRERREDIPLLCRYFAKHSPLASKGRITFSPKVASVLRTYSWPGNVRELQNVVERALILTDGDEVTVDDLPGTVRHHVDTTVQELTVQRPTLAELERTYIARLLEEFGGHRGRVAEALGISERNLYRKLKSFPTPAHRQDS